MRKLTAAEENARVHRHFGRVLALMKDAGPSAVGLGEKRLSAAQRVHRAHLLAELATYRARRRFPKNRRFATPTPAFVDEADGTRCAVAHLLEVSGERSLVARIASLANHARVPALANDDAFRGWLWRHGLGVREATIIQPAYCELAADCVCFLEDTDAVVEATVLEGGVIRIEAVVTGETALAAGDVVPFKKPYTGPEPLEGQRWIGGSRADAYDGEVFLTFPMPDPSSVDTSVCAAFGVEAPVSLSYDTFRAAMDSAGDASSCRARLRLEDPLWADSEGTACPEAPAETDSCASTRGSSRGTPWWAAALVAAGVALSTRRRI